MGMAKWVCAAALGCVAMAMAARRLQAQESTPAGGTSTLETPASAPELTMPAARLTAAQVEALQKKAADFGQIARYREENRALGPARPGETRVVFFGDSITDHWGRGVGTFGSGEAGVAWINRGIGGQTAPQMLVRFQQDVVSLGPQALVLLAGINDIAGNTGYETLPEIEDHLRSLVTLAEGAHLRVVVASLLPAGGFPWRPGVDPRAEIVALNRWLKDFAATRGHVYLDYYAAMATPDGGMRAGLSSDGVHPNSAGYAIMQPLAQAAVKKALAR
jgi:lysophospholipase L1-like esterase